jgi:hypothetical protein
MSNNNNNIVTPKSSTTKVVMANEAVLTFSKIILVHQDLLDFVPTMDLSLQSFNIPAAIKHWKKVTCIIQLLVTDIEQALKTQGSLSRVKTSIQKIKTQTNTPLKISKSGSKRNPHSA